MLRGRSAGRQSLALTATATPEVREEIVERLGLRDPRVIVRGFDRPNLFYEVYEAGNDREKRTLVTQVIAEGEADYPAPLADELDAACSGSGIIYTALTKTARGLSQWLNRYGLLAAYYHGQLKAGQRNAVQRSFTEGGLRAIAATNAFGMGIDLPDLHFVAHYDPPASLEAYYQESGRAGRDGAVARCPLFYRPEELGHGAFATGTTRIGAEDLERAFAAVQQAPERGATRAALTEQSGLSPAHVVRALRWRAEARTGCV